MLLLIPVDQKDVDEAQLSKLEDVKAWALLEMHEGRMQYCKFYDTREEIEGWIDCVIVQSEKEYIWPFMEENIAVLIAPMQRYIEDIVEAYLFKELHDISV
ncbi:MAG: hypothetical protein U9N30_00305 [Campylobacterota bacterium]|nr:hypothetical protein [Campylobacterota bacterium]